MALTPQAIQTAMEYGDMEPHVEWVDSETVHVLVSGFKRQELRVQVTSTGKLKISGERRVDGGRVSRFEKQLPIPDDCDVAGITAKYESEILQIRLPKSATAHVADPKHSHEPLSQPPPQLPDKHSHEPLPQLPGENFHEPLPKPPLLDVRSSHEQHFQEPHTELPDAKSSHEPFHVPRPQLHDDKTSNQQHFLLPGTRLPDVKSSHEQHFQEPHTKIPADKSSHAPNFQVTRPQLHDDKSSHQQLFLLPGTHLPDKHRPDATAAKPDLAKPVHDAEATWSGRDRKFGEVEARRPGMEPENSKSKLTVALVVVGALVVGYLSGRLDQAVRDGWTIVQRLT